MQINYPEILKKNILNVLKDVLKEIEVEGLKEDHHLYITFQTTNEDVVIPNWLKEKFPEEMTIVIQYEYWNFKVFEKKFKISLSFNDIKTNLIIPYNSIISFTDPYANFGLKLNTLINSKNKKKKYKTKKMKVRKNNIIDFSKFKKN